MADLASRRMEDRSRKPGLTALPRKMCLDRFAQTCLAGDMSSWGHFADGNLMELEPSEYVYRSGEHVCGCLLVFSLPGPWWPCFAFEQPIARAACIVELKALQAVHLVFVTPPKL